MSEHIHWSHRIDYRLLRGEDWSVHHKQAQRLLVEKGLQRPTPRKRQRPASHSVRRERAEHMHQVWARDFQFDAVANGRRLKFLNVINSHCRV